MSASCSARSATRPGSAVMRTNAEINVASSAEPEPGLLFDGRQLLKRGIERVESLLQLREVVVGASTERGRGAGGGGRSHPDGELLELLDLCRHLATSGSL